MAEAKEQRKVRVFRETDQLWNKFVNWCKMNRRHTTPSATVREAISELQKGKGK